MNTELVNSNRVAVAAFKLGIMGGTFTVTDVVLADDQTCDDALNLIHSTPGDKWFVILAESEGATLEVLALVTEDYEFNIVGLGTLVND